MSYDCERNIIHFKENINFIHKIILSQSIPTYKGVNSVTCNDRILIRVDYSVTYRYNDRILTRVDYSVTCNDRILTRVDNCVTCKYRVGYKKSSKLQLCFSCFCCFWKFIKTVSDWHAVLLYFNGHHYCTSLFWRQIYGEIKWMC